MRTIAFTNDVRWELLEPMFDGWSACNSERRMRELKEMIAQFEVAGRRVKFLPDLDGIWDLFESADDRQRADRIVDSYYEIIENLGSASKAGDVFSVCRQIDRWRQINDKLMQMCLRELSDLLQDATVMSAYDITPPHEPGSSPCPSSKRG